MKRLVGRLGGLFLFLLGASHCGAGGDLAPRGSVATTGSCTLQACNNGAGYIGDFSLRGAAPTSLEFSQCINGDCETAKLTPYPASSVYTCATAHRSRCEVSLHQDGVTAGLWVAIGPPFGADPSVSLKEGDRYAVTLGVPGEAPLMKLGATAGYVTFAAGCATGCKNVALMPVP